MKRKNTSTQCTYLKKVGSNIRHTRNEKGLSQESLALAADLDRSYVGGVERGERNISIVNLQKIAEALDTPLAQLLKGL